MLAENPLALSYILPGDVFFLPADRSTIEEPAIEIIAPEPVQAEEPVVPYTEPVAPSIASIPQVVIPQIPDIIIPQIPAIVQPPEPVVTETQNGAFKYTGGYQQKFLIIVHYPNHDVMEPAHLNALESTIKRRDLSMGEVAVFNIAQYPGTEIKAIGRFFKPKRMLLMGKDTFPVGMATPVFNQLTMLGTCQLLYSYSFGEMMGNKENTKAFWEQMKML